jgi:uncharacterized protein YllA (UPF0747 family)
MDASLHSQDSNMPLARVMARSALADALREYFPDFKDLEEDDLIARLGDEEQLATLESYFAAALDTRETLGRQLLNAV